MTPDITLSQALSDPGLFGSTFAAPSFWPWRVIAKLIDGLPLTEPREVELFEQCTGRTYDRQAVRSIRRIILLAGRRAGKDRFESAVAVWRAALCADWPKHTSAGEQAVVILLGADKKQAAILRRYCHGLLATPLLAREVVRTTGEVTEFRNGASLEIATNDARLVRGRSAIAVLGSECCHWRTDEHAASSDEEVVGAAEPSMAMCPDGGLLLLGSSVHRRRGYMFRQFRKLHGNEDADAVCWFAPSHVMNPKLPQHVIDKALAEDKAKASAEYLNIWREDIADFLPMDVIEAATDWGVHERPPQPDIRYLAFSDGAGGTGKDSFTLSIVHAEADAAQSSVVDLIRERKPRFVAADVIAEYANILRSYGITSIMSDNFGGGMHSDDWERNGIAWRLSPFNTSENYKRALSLLTSRRAHLLDNGTLRTQLAGLERRVTSGHEIVGHPQVASAHDDVAAAVCGALVLAAQPTFDEPRIVAPIVAYGQPRNVPGGVLKQGVVAAPLADLPQPVASQPGEPWYSVLARTGRLPARPAVQPTPLADPAEQAKLNYAAKLERIMTAPRNEPWRGFTSMYPMPIFPRG